MNDKNKTKGQILEEVVASREKVTELETSFNKYQQLESALEAELGLSIVKRMVDLQGGTIIVR